MNGGSTYRFRRTATAPTNPDASDPRTKNSSWSSPDKAASRLDVNTSPGSPGRGGVPIINTRPFGAAFVAGTMSSRALSVKICASSNTSTSTLSQPRPNPRSRAPNTMRESFSNLMTSSPDPTGAPRNDRSRATTCFLDCHPEEFGDEGSLPLPFSS